MNTVMAQVYVQRLSFTPKSMALALSKYSLMGNRMQHEIVLGVCT